MTRIRNLLQRVVTPLLTVFLIAGLWYAWHLMFEPSEPPEEDRPASEARTHVELAPIKLARAAIKTGKSEMRDLQESAWVPGRVTYDKTKHVNLRAATAGNIRTYHVKPGDQVNKGDLLVVVSFPEIGQTRAAEKQQLADLQLQTQQLNFLDERRKGIEQLIAAIKRGESLERIRQKYTEDEVGAAREPLLSAYAQLQLSKNQLARITDAANSGAISVRTAAERNAQYESADAALRGNVEQLLFDANQEVSKAKATVDTTKRQIELTRQQTATLMGYLSFAELPNVEEVPSSDLATVEIRAPISGTVEQLTLANSERVNAEESLLVLADTRVLWVEAQLRESQWRAISLRPEDSLRVTTPAFDEQLEASVNFVGRSVDAMTNSIPIVATLYNDGRLRPGLFVNVELPLGEKRNCLAVPEAAVAVHEAQSFVFIPLKENLFERRDVKTGQHVNGWIEITSGLKQGEEIVIEGGFFLKSELLLESEE